VLIFKLWRDPADHEVHSRDAVGADGPVDGQGVIADLVDLPVGQRCGGVLVRSDTPCVMSPGSLSWGFHMERVTRIELAH
jgi:hypothetical protein